MKLILVGGAYINAEDVAAIGSHPVLAGGCTIYFKFGAPAVSIPASPEEVAAAVKEACK